MIKLMELAKVFEDGLNAILNNPEIRFKIWSSAGEYQPFIREDNTVTWYINGNLKTSTSANDANDLVMGVNGLSLEFMVPIKQPRTNSKQTAEELARIKGGQYPFVDYIVSAINSYFQTAQSLTVDDLSISWQAGTAVSGDVDLTSELGNCMQVSVFIEMYFIQGGVNSKDIKITIDGNNIPFQAVRFGRSAMVERDVYADKLVSKNIITSSAFAIDIDVPVTKSGKEFSDYLFDGNPNVAHFVTVNKGNGSQSIYFMTINNVQESAQGVAIAGLSASLMEVCDNVFDVPSTYQVRKFIFDNTEPETIDTDFNGNPRNFKFTLSEACNVFIAGEARKGSSFYLFLKPTDFVYDEELNAYTVTMVTDNADVLITETSAPVVGVYNVYAVSGTYIWNDSLPYRAAQSTQVVNFKSKNNPYRSITYYGPRTLYNATESSATGTPVCSITTTGVTTWVNNDYKRIEFTDAEQRVSGNFYRYLIQNAKREF